MRRCVLVRLLFEPTPHQHLGLRATLVQSANRCGAPHIKYAGEKGVVVVVINKWHFHFA